MKINFSETIKDLKNETIKRQTENPDGTRGPDTDLTLSWVCIQALLAQGKVQIDGKEKLERFNLAMKLFPEGEIELTVDEVAKVKRLVGEMQSVLIVGRVFKLLEKEATV